MKTLGDTVILKKKNSTPTKDHSLFSVEKGVAEPSHLTGIFQYSLKIHWHEIHTKHNYIGQLVTGFWGRRGC